MKTTLALLTLLAACSPAGSDDGTEARRRHPDAGVRAPDATASDAASDGALDAGAAPGGTVSCYRQNNPAASCALPDVCCFNNYSSAHDGACSATASCAWGTIRCDGPEDCGAGQHCCATASVDPDEGLQGWHLACQASACGAAPGDEELCHPSIGCSGDRACVTAYGNANSLPRSLYVCR